MTCVAPTTLLAIIIASLAPKAFGGALATAKRGPKIGALGRDPHSPESDDYWNKVVAVADLAAAPANLSSSIPKWVDEWVVPEDIASMFPLYVTGYDEDGSPVYVLEYGNFKIAQALDGPGGREHRKALIIKYLEQSVYHMLRDGLANGGQGFGCILDWNGFSLANFADTMAVEVGLRQISTLNQLDKVLNYAFLVNTNFAAENFLRIARPFLGNILEKCEVFGTQRDKWLPKVLRKIPQSQLAPWLGGNEDWRPLRVGGGPAGVNLTKMFEH